jgi:transposase
LDVHKASVTACVLTFDDKGKRTVRKKEFRTFDQQLGGLMLWLMACKVSHVAMESTGVYSKPAWRKLEGKFELILTNPQHMKAIPGHGRPLSRTPSGSPNYWHMGCCGQALCLHPRSGSCAS